MGWLLEKSRFGNFSTKLKVARQNPEFRQASKSKPVLNPFETHRNLSSKPVKTHRNLSKSKGFDFCQNGIRVLPHNLKLLIFVTIRLKCNKILILVKKFSEPDFPSNQSILLSEVMHCIFTIYVENMITGFCPFACLAKLIIKRVLK